ncbi:MAG: penicillin-binding protein 2 [Chlamydiota bacterium]
MSKQNSEKARSKDWRRLFILALFLLGFFCAILARFYRVQIVEGKRWQKKASAQHQVTISEPFKRGRFFATTCVKKQHVDQNYPLVIDLKRYHLHADLAVIPTSCREKLVVLLQSLLQEGKKKVRLPLTRKSRSYKLQSYVIESEKKAITAAWRHFAARWKLPRNALYWVEDYQRSYPYGALLGAALGAVQDERDIKTQQRIPTGGLELFFHDQLRGKTGKRLVLRSPRQALATEKIVAQAKDGEDIYLTIDPYIQTIAEQELEAAVARVKAKGGWAVMMNPNTGEIYALAQYPDFDPSHYRDYYNDPSLIDCTRIKAATDCFEPGSTFKPIALAIALIANRECIRRKEPPLFDPTEMVRCDYGVFPGRKRVLRDVGGPHRFLNFTLAIQKSSSIYVAQVNERIIERFGADWYRKKLSNIFKLGTKTGIELPGETAGFVPSPHRKSEWSAATRCSLAMGYNISVNAFQLLRAYAILVTGSDVCPTLISGKNRENRANKRLIDAAISRELIDALKLNTKVGGTGTRAYIPGYTEAGKSGTAEKVVNGQYAKQVHFSSYIGFCPADEPQFLLFVGIDEPAYRLPGVGRTCFGGFCAAPAFKRIMQRTLHYLGIPPDDPYGYSALDPRFDADKADGVKEAVQLKQLYSEWNRK